ncbi:hypothetical protein CW706_00515 [Candidatus Bathyarchaeota archaeon]|nr:MAG: hypothetical protein CW706_00515 [Candidatus Bathyarchaeota archaeon]
MFPNHLVFTIFAPDTSLHVPLNTQVIRPIPCFRRFSSLREVSLYSRRFSSLSGIWLNGFLFNDESDDFLREYAVSVGATMKWRVEGA